jgi:hypothetical protein
VSKKCAGVLLWAFGLVLMGLAALADPEEGRLPVVCGYIASALGIRKWLGWDVAILSAVVALLAAAIGGVGLIPGNTFMEKGFTLTFMMAGIPIVDAVFDSWQRAKEDGGQSMR